MTENYLKQANSFRSLDDLLQNQKDPTLLNDLFVKKNKLLALVDGGQLTAQKYVLFCQKVMKEATTQKIKDSTEMEMIDLADDKVSWFKDVISETKEKLEDQKKMLSKMGIKASPIEQKPAVKTEPQITKPENKEAKIQPKPQPQTKTKIQPKIQPKIQKKSSKQTKPQTKPIQKSVIKQAPIDYSKIYSFKVLDSLMDQNGGNKQLYMTIFEQKQKIIKLVKQKKITAEVYRSAVDNLAKNTTNEDISFAVGLQIDQLKQFHNGQVESWFKDRLEQTQQQMEKQKQKYSIFKTGKSVQSKQKQDIDLGGVEKLAQGIAEKAKKSNLSKNTVLFSFRYLDQQMEKNTQDPKLYSELFEQKTKYIQMIQKEQIDAQGYRDILAQIVQESNDQDLKGAAETEIDLHDITGDVDQFFKSAIQETGEKYEEQEKLYKKFGIGKKSLNLGGGKSGEVEKKVEIQIKQQKQYVPDLADIVSFTVLVKYLEKYQKNYDYCSELKEKGSKLLKLVEQKKLGPNQYIRFLQAKIEQAKDKQTVAIMKKQLASLQKSENLTKEFNASISQYLNKTKVNLGNRTSFDSQIFIDENTVNQAAPKIKIEYLIRKLGSHQSLYVYMKNNKLQFLLKDYEKQYLVAKKNTLTLCQKIKNGAAGKIDIVDFAQKNLPKISFSVLNREPRTKFDERLNLVIEKIKGTNQKIGEYLKTLKKGTNKSNIEEANKMIEENNKLVNNLGKLKNQDLIPFPKIEQNEIEMYNLDLNKHLTQNQIQIKVTNFEGIKDHLIFRIFVIDMKKHRFQAKVQDGHVTNIRTIIKIPPEIMEDIIKGSTKRYLLFTLSSKGFFSESLIAQADMELNFIRNNRMQDRLTLKQDRIFMDYIINVNKPRKPIITKITKFNVTQYPKYEPNPFVEKQFIKTIMPFQKKTQSEIPSKIQ